MESYAHSHSRPPISAPPFSKNSYNVNSHRNATAFTAYDAVFGGPPRFAAGPGGALSPRAEEYGEIFNGFNLRASSSIPVLDLPAVDDDVASFDPARSRFDYSEVFGGFGNVEFVPFDELFRQSDGGDGCSDEEVWTPAGTESFSDESDPWACSEKDQRLPNGNAQQSYDSKQYNVSYHEVSPSARENTDNLTHVAQLNAVRGYSYVVDEAKSLHKVEEEIFCAQVADDIILSMDSFGNVTQENNMRKAASRISDGDSHSSDNNHRQGKACGSSGVHPNSTSNSASDINLRMEPSHLPLPSRPPLVSTDGTEDSGKLNSDYKASKTYDFELAVDGGSSPFFDVEVNASSSAVASAAAMKEAMDKAQLKLKSAKELMARRKDGHQKSPKMALNNDEGVMKVASASCSLMDNRLQAACEVEHVELKNPDKERPGAASARQLCHEQPTNLTEKLSQRNQVKKSSLSPDHVSIEEAGKWKKEMQYYEFVTAESSIASPQPNNGNNLAQKENSSQPSSINGMTEALKGQEDSDEGDLNSAGEAHELEDNRPRLKATKSASRRGFHEKMVKVAQEVHERVVCEHAETEKRLNNTCERNENDIKPKSYCRQDDIELDQSSQAVDRRKPREAVPDKAAETMLKDTLCREANKKKEGKAPQTEENGNRIKEAYEKRMKEAHERDKEESTIAEEQERESKERRKKEAFANHENEQRLKEASYGHENYKSEEAYKQNEDRGSGDKDKKRLMEAAEKELGGEKILEVCEIQETEKMNEVQQREEYETRLGEVVLQEKPEEIIVEVGLEDCKKHDEAVGTMKTKKCMHVEDELNQKEVQESDGKIEKVLEEEQMEKKSVLVSEKGESRMELENEGEGERWKAVPNTSRQVEWGNKNEKPYSTPGINMHMEDECLKASDEVCDLEVEDLTQTLPNENEEPHRKTKANKEVIGPKENGNIGVKPVVDQEKSKASEPTKVLIEEKPAECKMHGPRTESSSKSLPRNDENLKRRGMLEQNKEVPVIVSCSKDPRRFNHELGGRSMDVGEGMVFFDPGKDKDNSTPSAGENGTEHMKKTEAACPVMLQRNWSTEKRSQMPNKNQTIERNGKTINNNRSMEEKEREKEERLKRERELEEHLRKLEEEREREREREKDRIAVEIATREARDKAAFDRAIAESRQRAMAESRERLERACAEARERSSVQKSSNEARLRAEPAAVERATAEARERVIEKAMAERAASEARERIQRSMSDNFSSCSRGADMRKSFLYSSSAKFESTEVEPVQRCTARLERHRRTVERVAKALEEKNMRDLLAQREQAERNRLAEMLDADIRRWLSGKEGNLRALLSTLQYILGPESGWTPIPLTEVITTAAVKKAYRKATLCVHPDKLQQRGASIQQKYICEKVFDLLKEAWNKFNSEER